MSDFPSIVRIGYRDYKIVRWAVLSAGERDAWGETSNHLGEIRIAETLLEHEPVKAANTLLHEILHACWYVGDLNDEDKQERCVTILANQLSQVWRDNPAVVAYLSGCLRP